MKKLAFIIIFYFLLTSISKTINLDPLFIENRGQMPNEIKFYTKSGNGICFVGKNFFGFYTVKNGRTLTYKIFTEGTLKKGEKNHTRVNYYIKGKKYENLITYKNLKFKSPNYELILYKIKGRVEWKIISNKPVKIRLKYDTGNGKLEAKKNKLFIKWGKNCVIETIPGAYLNGKEIEFSYKLEKNNKNVVIFNLNHNRGKTVIDPSTFLGGINDERCKDIKTHNGIVYVTGTTSSEFNKINLKPGEHNLTDETDKNIFIAKLTKSLLVLKEITFLDSNSDDDVYSMALSDSKVFICGKTSDPNDFLNGNLTNLYEASHQFSEETGFLLTFNMDNLKLDQSKSFLVGGEETDICYDIFYENNKIFICGRTDSENFFPSSTTGASTSWESPSDPDEHYQAPIGFVGVIDISHDEPEFKYGSYFGNYENDSNKDSDNDTICLGITTDGNNIYTCGYTETAHITGFNQNTSVLIYEKSAFISKGSIDCMNFNTILLDGGKDDVANDIVVNKDKNLIYITGTTNSDDLISAGFALQGEKDGFVACIDSNFEKIARAIAIGDPDSDDYGYKIDLIPGLTENDNDEIFISQQISGKAAVGKVEARKLDSQPEPVNFENPINVKLHNSDEGATYGICVNENSQIYVAGYTTDDDFPTTPPVYDKSFNGEEDGFITSLNKSDLTILPQNIPYIKISYPANPPEQTLDPQSEDFALNFNSIKFTIITDSFEGFNFPNDGVTFSIKLFDENGNPCNLSTSQVNSISKPINLALISNSPNQIPEDSVQIVKWKEGTNEIKIKINSNPLYWQYSSGALENPYFLLFVKNDNWPHVDSLNSNFEDDKYQDSTICIVKNTLNSNSQTHRIMASFYDENGNIALKYGIKFLTQNDFINMLSFTFQTDSDRIPSKVKKIAPSIEKFVIADVGRISPGSTSNHIVIKKGFKKDFLTINSRRRSLFVFFREKSNQYISHTFTGTPISIAVADLDKDGKNEIVIGFLDGTIEIYKINSLAFNKWGNFDFIEKVFEIKTDSEPANSKINDINGDGKYDYIYLDKANDSLVILFGENLSEKKEFLLDGIPEKMAVVDINGDGLEDICIVKSTGSSLSIVYNTGENFTLDELNLQDLNFPYNDIDSGDFNRDGISDIAISSESNQLILPIFGSKTDLILQDPLSFVITPSAISISNFDAMYGDDILAGFSDYWELALCTSDSEGIITPKYSLNTIDDLIIDENGTKLPEDDIANIVEGISYGGVNDKTGIAGITQQEFNLFYFPKSKDISFSAVNTYDDSILLNLELYKDNGELDKYTSISIPSNSQYANFFSSEEIFGNDVADEKFIRCFSSKAKVYGIYLFNPPNNPNNLDGGKLISAGDIKTTGIMPIIKEGGGFTHLYIINPFKDQNSIILRLMSNDGTLKEEKDFLFNPREEKIFEISELFNSPLKTDYVIASSDKGFIGLESYGDDNTLGILYSMFQKNDTKVLYCPHVASGNFGEINYISIVDIVNISDTGGKIDIALLSDDGEKIAEKSNYNIGAKEKLEFSIKDFFQLEENSSITGYLKISYEDDISLVGCITFKDEGENFSSTLPFMTKTGNFITGHIANGEIGGVNYWTGIAILSPIKDEYVKIKVIDKYGNILGEKTITIGAGKRFVSILNGDMLFPDMGDTFGGTISITTEDKDNLLVFQLFGDQDGKFLCAVPANQLVNNE